ncbi:leucine-rich repeat receptor-like protein kinase pxl2-like protein, partial [Trifolium pratense]
SFSTASKASNDEVSALLSIKEGLVDPLNSLHDWKLDADHCNWTGIKCNADGKVEILDLSHKNLSVNLTTLNILDVSQNFFIGEFPLGFGKALKLASLNVSSNEFNGSIPVDIGNATSLEMLDLRGSFFEGSIPKSFGNLNKLKFLGLSGNNLTGKIPGELGKLSSLEYMI